MRSDPGRLQGALAAAEPFDVHDLALAEGPKAGHVLELDVDSARPPSASVGEHRDHLIARVDQLTEVGLDVLKGRVPLPKGA